MRPGGAGDSPEGGSVMRRNVLWACVVAALAPAGARADQAADVKAIIDKAVKATGGADVLKKYPAVVLKGKGQLHGDAGSVDFNLETRYQPPDKQRVELEAAGNTTTIVYDGKEGWAKATGGEAKEMDADTLNEFREEGNVNYASGLLPLQGDEYRLSPLEETKVRGKPAVGVRAQRKGYRDLDLYFDKDDGLLVMVRHQAVDVEGGKKEYRSDTIFGDYHKVMGQQVPYKITVRRDGKRYIESEVTEARVAEKLDAGDFAKP
jgi:hypothetical protein